MWLVNCFYILMIESSIKYRRHFPNILNVLGILLFCSILGKPAPLQAEPAIEAEGISTAADIEPAANNSDEDSLSSAIPPSVNANDLKDYLQPRKLHLRSSAVLVMDEQDNVTFYERHADEKRPIASLTKLMTAMVILDANLPMDEAITVTRDDQDKIRRSRSRLHFGVTLSRADMLLMALAASENRAALALARTYPGGSVSFVKAMNQKAKELGLVKTKYLDAAGLHTGNVSTPNELAVIIKAAYQYPLIREMTTTERSVLYDTKSDRYVEFVNTNRLVRSDNWDIDLSKTGFISEAGFCLVMRANVASRPVLIVLLNSWGKLSKYGDANRIKTWLQNAEQKVLHVKNNFASMN
jgi:D-alanyl-D-alanine endopeptidase (penicillin-binding protein 7)